MITLALTAAVLAQTADTRSPVGVVLTSRRPNTESLAPKVAARVVEVLKREGVAALDDARVVKELKGAGFSDPRSCNGGQACSAKLAVLLGPKAVLVAVDVAKLGGSVAIHLEAFASDLPEALAVADITAKEEKWSDQSLADITSFARRLKDKLTIAAKLAVTPPPPPPVERPVDPTDQPKNATLTPTEPTRTDVTQQGPAPSRAVPIALVSGAGALTVAAGVLGALAGIDRARYDGSLTMVGGMVVSTLPRNELDALGSSINTKFWASMGCAAGAAVLGLIGALLFIQ